MRHELQLRRQGRLRDLDIHGHSDTAPVTMSFLVLLLLSLQTGVSLSTKIQGVEISVLEYETRSNTNSKGHQQLYYSMEFCGCRSSYSGHKPEKSSLCECSSKIKGKTVKRSTPFAKFSASCIYSNDPKQCMNAQLQDSKKSKIFVKMNVGGKTLTSPAWQEIQVKKFKSSVKLSTNNSKPVKLTYLISVAKGTRVKSGATSSSHIHHITPVKAKHRPWSTIAHRTQFRRKQWKKIAHRLFTKHGKGRLPSWLKNRKPHHHAHRNNVVQTSRKTLAFNHSPAHKMGNTKSSTSTSSNIHELSDVLSLISQQSIKKYVAQGAVSHPMSPSTYDVKVLKSELVRVQNLYRSMHSCPAVKQDSVLDSEAQRWADQLAFHHGCLVHETPRKYGENLFFFGASNFPTPTILAKAVAQSFYQEGHRYDYSKFNIKGSYKAGHFTQMIWKSSTKVGVGITIKYNAPGGPQGHCQPSHSAYLIYVVIKYDPPGNIQSKELYTNNVPAPTKRL